ncbi:MAG: hypothetical protein U5K84_02750 [Alkalibacterium sp.]|nr:hypothetical protein [Alkalibacterium sp.]
MANKFRRKHVASKILKHIVIILIILVVAWLFLFIMGNFVALHPNAYRDLIRSILVPYGIGILCYNLYAFIYKKKSLRGSSRKLSLWWENITALESICLMFTLITVINSLMMITGIDTPKQGVFAYVHMMTRLGIVSFIVVLLMWKDIVQSVRQFSFRFNIRKFFQDAHKRIMISVSIVFTALTTVFCVAMIAFQETLDPVGGVFFYQLLLGMLSIITISIVLLRIIRM